MYELEAAAGLLYAGRVRSVRGAAIELMAWEPGLRALYNGVPLYHPETLDLRDRHGRPLDAEQAFTLADDRDDMAHFLRTAGYLFVRGLLDGGEVERLLAGAAVVASIAAVAGMLASRGASQASPTAASTSGPRFTRVTADAAFSTEPALSRDGTLVVYASGRDGEGQLDLWLQRTSGGQPVRITNDTADDRQPDFSPDGSMVVFSRLVGLLEKVPNVAASLSKVTVT